MTGRDNDSESMDQVLVSFAPRVYGLLLRLVGRPEVAEDLMQETMLRAYRSLDTYRPEGKFRAWVFRIAVNQARDWVRRRPREAATSLDDGTDMPDVAALRTDDRSDTAALKREVSTRVEGALARLADADREVLLLRFYGDLAFKDIARVTGEPLGTVLARAHRALKKLGDILPEEEP
jgi:RNA polymerase sigma-70 factor, ECF subfamily